MKVNKDFSGECCIKCGFYIYYYGDAYYGECCNKPPESNNGWGGGGFPQVVASDWCGNFKVLTKKD